MKINTAIESFEQELVGVINKYELPMAIKRSVLRNIMSEVNAATQAVIVKESEETEEEENGISES